MKSFNEFGLAAPLERALTEEKYVTPTPIQVGAIPPVLAGRDLVGIAQTGTGKTAAFALPILNHLLTHRIRAEQRACRVLVLSPTRELSGQILESFRTYGRHVRPTTALVIGGVPMGRQVRALVNGVDVLVATPGRLLDLMQNHAVRLDRIEVFVLDEADRMLDMGFIRDIRRIVAKLPAQRQTLFFSATMPQEIEKLVSELLRDPVRIAVSPVTKTADRVEQRIVHVDRADKPELLASLLKSEPVDRALVFTRTKHGADKVVRGLVKACIAAEAIHGNKSQSNRERALEGFRAGRVRTLVATDIAARGIDVEGISHVFNYDLPNIPESYVHRIGRTARAGADGIAISFCSHDELPFLRDIEKLIRITIPSTDQRRQQHAAPRAANAPRQRDRQQHGRPGGNHRGRQELRHEPRQESRHEPRQPRHEPARTEQSNGHTGEIGSVAFMQQRKRNHRRNNGGNGARRPAY
ncbi:MAG: DEAD/DEAH box helicase [Xanthobacteraceae bacterium]